MPRTAVPPRTKDQRGPRMGLCGSCDAGPLPPCRPCTDPRQSPLMSHDQACTQEKRQIKTRALESCMGLVKITLFWWASLQG